MKYIIDRIEGTIAVCEDENREMVNISVVDFPFKAKEGMAFGEKHGVYRAIDNSERHKRIEKLMNDLWS